MAQPTDVGLVLTQGQLWAALVTILSAFVFLLIWIYNKEQERTNQRLNGLHTKITTEVEALREDYNNKLTVQNQQLVNAAAAIQDAVDEFNTAYHELDKRLLKHELTVRS